MFPVNYNMGQVLAVVSIGYDNIVLIKVIAEFGDNDVMAKKKYDGARNKSG